eukprot:4359368-Pleurochrysis_carterae.AAC.2
MLAFKNDLSFWSSVDTMEGLSSRSLLLNEAMEVIILLYLIEEDSSWLIKITSVCTASCVSAVLAATQARYRSASSHSTSPSPLAHATSSRADLHAGTRSVQDFQVVFRQAEGR